MRLLLLLVLLVSCGQDVIVKEYKGIDGNSCFTSTDHTGINIQCTDGTISHLDYPKNGIDAKEIITVELCKDITNKPFTEIAIIFPDGDIVAYAAWNGGFLTKLERNYFYSTSDGYSCNFYVDSNNNIVYN